jgi:RNA methyltransferase, TrmH family
MPTSHQAASAMITSAANPRVKWLVSLRRRRARDAEGVTVVEGCDELRLALAAGVAPRQLFWCDALADSTTAQALLPRVTALGSEVVALGPAAFAKASYRDSPDGWLAVVDSPGVPLDAVTLGERPLVLVCEAIEKPGNLGAMLRTAEAVGVDAVVAASPVADWGNPNLVRASKGTVFAVQVASGPTEDGVAWLRGRALSIVVATPEASTAVTEVDLTRPVAVVVGAEHAGVGASLLQAADTAASLPMTGRVNSLNVAASAAVVLYEAVRQRAQRLGP